jgi:Tfp pilus assembly PilM family ATPase
MPKNIIGLDIGQTSLKAVLLAGGRVLATATVAIGADGIEAALKTIAQNPLFLKTPVHIALPLSDVVLRQVKLPFRDVNKIRQALPFELEPLIPYALDEVIADYHPISDDGLLVAAVTKTKIREWITAVETNLGEATAIDIAVSALALQIPERKESKGVEVVLDIGATSTQAAFLVNGKTIQMRSFAFGGYSVTAALASDLEVDWSQAEQMKISSTYKGAISGAENVCRRFCIDLKNTIEFMRLNDIFREDIDRIILTGGGCLFLPLQKEMETLWCMTPEMLDIAGYTQIQMQENIRGQFEPPLMNTALAAAMHASSGRKSFNFRQGEFAIASIRTSLQGQIKWAAGIACVILLLAAVNQYLDYRLLDQRAARIKSQISQIFKKNYPEAQTMVDPVSQLRAKLADNKKTYGFYDGLPDATAIDFLKEISSRITPALDIIITGYHYESGAILIKGEAKKVDDISAVRNELLKSIYFKDVSMGQTSLAKQGGKVDFDLRIELK